MWTKNEDNNVIQILVNVEGEDIVLFFNYWT